MAMRAKTRRDYLRGFVSCSVVLKASHPYTYQVCLFVRLVLQQSAGNFHYIYIVAPTGLSSKNVKAFIPPGRDEYIHLARF